MKIFIFALYPILHIIQYSLTIIFTNSTQKNLKFFHNFLKTIMLRFWIFLLVTLNIIEEIMLTS